MVSNYRKSWTSSCWTCSRRPLCFPTHRLRICRQRAVRSRPPRPTTTRTSRTLRCGRMPNARGGAASVHLLPFLIFVVARSHCHTACRFRASFCRPSGCFRVCLVVWYSIHVCSWEWLETTTASSHHSSKHSVVHCIVFVSSFLSICSRTAHFLVLFRPNGKDMN